MFTRNLQLRASEAENGEELVSLGGMTMGGSIGIGIGCCDVNVQRESDRYTCVLVIANIWTGTTNGLVTVTKALGQTDLAEDTRETR